MIMTPWIENALVRCTVLEISVLILMMAAILYFNNVCVILDETAYMCCYEYVS